MLKTTMLKLHVMQYVDICPSLMFYVVTKIFFYKKQHKTLLRREEA